MNYNSFVEQLFNSKPRKIVSVPSDFYLDTTEGAISTTFFIFFLNI